jgi:valyl-tRNA synthetase
MVCTFGDVTDVIWWRELELETRPILGADGRIARHSGLDCTPPQASEALRQLAGKTVFQRQGGMVEMLRISGDLLGGAREDDTPGEVFRERR